MTELVWRKPRRQTECAPAAFQVWNSSRSKTWASFHRVGNGILVRFPELADFELLSDAEPIVCTPALHVSKATVEVLYLHQIVPLALSQRGELVFHASVVEDSGIAIAFPGPSGRGKSTIAAAFAAEGGAFLTDDVALLRRNGDLYEVESYHPTLRLWQDSRERLLPTHAGTPPPQTCNAKARLVAGAGLAHCRERRRLLSAFFLGDGSTPDIAIRPLTAAESLIEWTRHSFLLDGEHRPSVAAQFDRIATLANSVRCYALDYPRRYDLLNKVLDSIRLHARSLEAAM